MEVEAVEKKVLESGGECVLDVKLEGLRTTLLSELHELRDTIGVMEETIDCLVLDRLQQASPSPSVGNPS